MLTLAERSRLLLSPTLFPRASRVVRNLPYPAAVLDIPDDQYVLRMLVMSPESGGLRMPPELQWLRSTLELCTYMQSEIGVRHPYIYVTVRSGIVRSVADDEWHVDGFSMRVPHVPEQNYVWADSFPTEVLDQQFVIPDDFDPLKHNIHQFFQDRADESRVRVLAPQHLHLIDPYIVHRRPAVVVGTRRTFFRISFVPIQIEDDTNTANPLLPVPVFGRTDVRKTLSRY